MFGQGSSAAEGRWWRAKSMETLHCDPSGRSQDSYKTYSDISLYYNAQLDLNRVFDPISTAGIHFEYPHGSSEATSYVHACLSWHQYISIALSLLLRVCPILEKDYRSSSWRLSASEGRHRPGCFDLVCGMGWGLWELQATLCHQTWVWGRFPHCHAELKCLLAVDSILSDWNSWGILHCGIAGIPLRRGSWCHEKYRVCLCSLGRGFRLLCSNYIEQHCQVSDRESQRRASFLALPEHKYWKIWLLVLASHNFEFTQFHYISVLRT